MPKRSLWMLMSAAIFCSACDVGAPQAPGAQDRGKEIGASLTEKYDVPLAQVPAGVMAVARKARPDLQFQQAQSESRSGVAYFDIEGVTATGEEIELDIMAQGDGWTVVEIQRDIHFQDVPDTVRAALAAEAPRAIPARIIESVQTDGIIIYEFYTRSNSSEENKYEVKLDGSTAKFLDKEWVH